MPSYWSTRGPKACLRCAPRSISPARITTPKGRGRHKRAIASQDEAALEIFEYIECPCDWVRIHSALENLRPEEFEKRNMEEDSEGGVGA